MIDDNAKFEIIAHRGLLNGPDSDNENNPSQIQKAINSGFSVEIDVRLINGELWLGHNHPIHIFPFKPTPNIWCHAKNIDALSWLLINGYHCFWHQEDDYTLTSLNYEWVYPNKKHGQRSICVMPEKTNYSTNYIKENFLGVCTDYPHLFK